MNYLKIAGYNLNMEDHKINISEIEEETKCQQASKIDPASASGADPDKILYFVAEASPSLSSARIKIGI
ncbi:MAG: hypothetical protein ABSC11_08460 [Smithella sp.]|jgi:hypothetical protein